MRLSTKRCGWCFLPLILVFTSCQKNRLPGFVFQEEVGSVYCTLPYHSWLFVGGQGKLYVMRFDEEGQRKKAPQIVTSVKMPGKGMDMALVKERYLYVAGGIAGGLVVYDVSNPAAPQEVFQLPVGDSAVGLKIVDNYAYLAADEKGVMIFDISQPEEPRRITTFDTPGQARNIDVDTDKGIAYVADFGYGVRILDVQNPKEPKEIRWVYTAGPCYDLDYENGYVYTACWSKGLRIIDVHNVEKSKVIGKIKFGALAWGVQVEGKRAYMAAYAGGLRVVSVEEPTAPKEVAHYPTAGVALHLTKDASRVYLACGYSGLHIIPLSVTP